MESIPYQTLSLVTKKEKERETWVKQKWHKNENK